MTMKRIILSIAAAALMAGCTDSDTLHSGNVTGDRWGSLSVGVTSVPDVEIRSMTKAGSVPADAANYILTISNPSLPTFQPITGTYGMLTWPLSLRSTIGAEYTILAESCTEVASLSANDGWGKARYTDRQSFGIVAGQVTNLTLNCRMANTQISIGYDASFSEAFSDYSVKATDGTRELSFDAAATTDAPVAFFSIPDNGKITLNITATYDGTPRSFTQTVSVAAATWHKLTLQASRDNGKLGITITTDDTLTEKPEDVIVYPDDI